MVPCAGAMMEDGAGGDTNGVADCEGCGLTQSECGGAVCCDEEERGSGEACWLWPWFLRRWRSSSMVVIEVRTRAVEAGVVRRQGLSL